MQITVNTTGMAADLTVAADKDARDYCVVVVKGTFETDAKGQMRLATEQIPPVPTDEHYGDPETTAVRYESDFCLHKPNTDVVLVGKAVAPGGKPVVELPVRLEINGRAKDALAVGPRRWVSAAGGVVASPPVAFAEMELRFDQAFGGQDDSAGAGKGAAELRNLVGVGFHRHRSRRDVDGTPLPCIERANDRVRGYRDKPAPVGFGVVGRAWQPRVGYAGTYDQRWLDEVCPFLPEDFDDHYHQAAPADQQIPYPQGGEVIRCVHMSAERVVQYCLPKVEVPIVFGFRERDEVQHAVLDTVVVEPHLRRAMLVWRARAALGKNLDELKEIRVGTLPNTDDGFLAYRRTKPVFRGIQATIQWLRRRGGHRS